MYYGQYKNLPELIWRVQQEEPEAMAAFLKKIDAKLRKYILYHVRDVVELQSIKDEDVRDIMQEVVIKLVQLFRGDGYTELGTFFRLLFKMTGNCVIDFYKHRPVMVYSPEVMEALAETLADETEDENETDVRDKHRKMLWKAANTLHGQQKTIFILRLYGEKEYEEIGELLNISPKSASSTYHKALMKVVNLVYKYKADEEKKEQAKKVEAEGRKNKVPVVIIDIRPSR